MHRTDHDELYNLDVDPLEIENVAADPEHTERIHEMGSLIKEMVKQDGPGFYAWCLDS